MTGVSLQRVVLSGSSLALNLLLAGCANAPSTLAPRGPAAAEIATLSWVMFGLAAVVFAVVMGLLLYALFRSRREARATYPSTPGLDRTFIIWGGIVVPLIILIVLFIFTIRTMAALAAPERANEVVVEVVGHQFWWEIHYPNQGFTTANEIHLPVGQPIELRLTSADVIHSFWVPELHGKRDLLPHRVNSFWLQADEAGVFYGACAEFCGIQHAKMALVVVEPEEQFAAWLEQQAQPAAAPTETLAQQGQQVFLSSSCIQCHTIRGTNATGTLGPDLTHLASRLTLAAGIVENNSGNLGGWIIDPHSIKPGNLMPPTNLSGPELQALLAYLQSLE